VTAQQFLHVRCIGDLKMVTHSIFKRRAIEAITTHDVCFDVDEIREYLDIAFRGR